MVASVRIAHGEGERLVGYVTNRRTDGPRSRQVTPNSVTPNTFMPCG